jgi:hypothetical protein
MQYTVVKVRKEPSTDKTHRHIQGVITSGGYFYSRRQVVDSINAGNSWKTSALGLSASIHVASFCPAGGCLATPYIKTVPNSTRADNLENLPEG